jgi:hypothetical protein
MSTDCPIVHEESLVSSAAAQVRELVERFDRNREAYKRPTYNEAQVRLEFIDPLFKALGWDVYNEQGHAEAYKDVIHEDAIKVGGATKDRRTARCESFGKSVT